MSFLTSFFGVKAQELDEIKILSPQEFKSRISDKKVQLVDVRTRREFLTGHIDVFRLSAFEKQFEKLDKNKPVYLYCRSGMRSQKAARQLVRMGFQQICDLGGGYLNWR
jgi:rhodanese-related sulfurtransferase